MPQEFQPYDAGGWQDVVRRHSGNSQSAVSSFRSFAGSFSVADLFQGDPMKIEEELETRYERLSPSDRKAVDYSYRAMRARIADVRRAQKLTQETQQVRGYLEGGAAERGGGFLEGASSLAGNVTGYGAQPLFNILQGLQSATVNKVTGAKGTVGGGLSEFFFGQGAQDLTAEEASIRAKVGIRSALAGEQEGRRQLQAQQDIEKLVEADAFRKHMGLPGLLTDEHRKQIQSLGLSRPGSLGESVAGGSSLEDEVGRLAGFLTGARVVQGAAGMIPGMGVVNLPAQLAGTVNPALGRIAQEATTFGLYEAGAQRDLGAALPGAAFGAAAGAVGEGLGAIGRGMQGRYGQALAESAAKGESSVTARALGQVGSGLEGLGGRSTPTALGGRPSILGTEGEGLLAKASWRPTLASIKGNIERLPETISRVGARSAREYAKFGVGGAASELTSTLQHGEEVDIGKILANSFGEHTAITALGFGLLGGTAKRERVSDVGGNRRARGRQETSGRPYPSRGRGETDKEYRERLRSVQDSYTRLSGEDRRVLQEADRIEAEARARGVEAPRASERVQALRNRTVESGEAAQAPVKGPLSKVAGGAPRRGQAPEFARSTVEKLLDIPAVRERIPGWVRTARRTLLEETGQTLTDADVEALRSGKSPRDLRRKFQPNVRQFLRQWFRYSPDIEIGEMQGPPTPEHLRPGARSKVAGFEFRPSGPQREISPEEAQRSAEMTANEQRRREAPRWDQPTGTGWGPERAAKAAQRAAEEARRAREQQREERARARAAGENPPPRQAPPRRDPYEVLGVGRDIDIEGLKKAFRAAAFANHPDRNPNDPGAHERFVEIGDAYLRILRRLEAEAVRKKASEVAPDVEVDVEGMANAPDAEERTRDVSEDLRDLEAATTPEEKVKARTQLDASLRDATQPPPAEPEAPSAAEALPVAARLANLPAEEFQAEMRGAPEKAKPLADAIDALQRGELGETEKLLEQARDSGLTEEEALGIFSREGMEAFVDNEGRLRQILARVYEPKQEGPRLSDDDRARLDKYAKDRLGLRYAFPAAGNHQRFTDFIKDPSHRGFIDFLEQFKEADGKVPPGRAWGLLFESLGVMGDDPQRVGSYRKAWNAWNNLVGIRGGAEAFDELLAAHQEAVRVHYEKSQDAATALVSHPALSKFKNPEATVEYLRKHVAELAASMDQNVSIAKSYDRAKNALREARRHASRLPGQVLAARAENALLAAEKAFGLHGEEYGARVQVALEVSTLGVANGVKARQWKERYLAALNTGVNARETSSGEFQWNELAEGKKEYLDADGNELSIDQGQELLFRHLNHGSIATELLAGEPSERVRGMQESYLNAYERHGIVERVEGEIPKEFEGMSPETVRELLGLGGGIEDLKFRLTPRGRRMLEDLQRWQLESGTVRGLSERFGEGFFSQREDPFTYRCLSTCGLFDRIVTRTGKILSMADIGKWRRENVMMDRDMTMATASHDERIGKHRRFFQHGWLRMLFQTYGEVMPESVKANQANYAWSSEMAAKTLQSVVYSKNAIREWFDVPRQMVDPEGWEKSPHSARMKVMARALDGDPTAWSELTEREHRWARDIQEMFDTIRPHIVEEIFRPMRRSAVDAEKRSVGMHGEAVPDFIEKWDTLVKVREGGTLAPLGYEMRLELMEDAAGAKLTREMIDAKKELRPGEEKTFRFGNRDLVVEGWGIKEYWPHVFIKQLPNPEGFGDMQSQLGDTRPHPNGMGTRAAKYAADMYTSAYPRAIRPKMLRHMMARAENAEGWLEDIPFVLEQYIGRTFDYIARSRSLDTAKEEFFGTYQKAGSRDATQKQLEAARLQKQYGDDWESYLGEQYKDHGDFPLSPQSLDADLQSAPTVGGHELLGLNAALAQELLIQTRGALPIAQDPGYRKGARRKWFLDRGRTSLGKHSFKYFTDEDVVVLVSPTETSAAGGKKTVVLRGKQIPRAGIFVRQGGLSEPLTRYGGKGGWNDVMTRVVELAENRSSDIWRKDDNSIVTQAARSVASFTNFVGRMLYRGVLGGVAGVNSKAMMVNVLEGVGVQNMAAMGPYAWGVGTHIMASLGKHQAHLMAEFYKDAARPMNQRRGYHELLNEIADKDPSSTFAQAWNYVLRDSPFRIGKMRDLEAQQFHDEHVGGIILNTLRHIPGVGKIADKVADNAGKVKDIIEERYDPIHFAWFEYSELMTRLHLALGYGFELGKRHDPNMNGGLPWQNPENGMWAVVGNDYSRRNEGLGTEESPKYLTVQDLVWDRVEATHFHYKRALQPGLMRIPGWGVLGHLGTYSQRLMTEALRDVGSFVRYHGGSKSAGVVDQAGSARLLTRLAAFWVMSAIHKELTGLDMSSYGGVHPRDVPGLGDLPIVNSLPDMMRLAGGPPSFPSMPVKLIGGFFKGMSDAQLLAELRNQSGEGFGASDWMEMVGRRVEQQNPALWIPDLGAWTLPVSAFTIPFSRSVEPFLRAVTADPDPNQPGNVRWSSGGTPYSIPNREAWNYAFLPGTPQAVSAKYQSRKPAARMEEFKGRYKRELADEIAGLEGEGKIPEANAKWDEAERLGLGRMDQSVQGARRRGEKTALRAEIQRAGDPVLRVQRALELWSALTPAERAESWNDVFGVGAEPGVVPEAHDAYFTGEKRGALLERFMAAWRNR